MRSVRSFVAVFSTDHKCAPLERPRFQKLPGWSPTHLISTDRRAELVFVNAEASPEDEPLPSGGRLTLVVGDDAEWDATQGRACMAGAACVEWDPRQSSVRVVSSIVGVPPIFILRMLGVVAVASELHLFRALEGLQVVVDPQSVVDLFTVGFPLEHRSLFREITVMPGGHVFQVNGLGLADLAPCWEPLEPQSDRDRSSYIELQVEAFRQAMSKLRLSDSLLSLTGGLDTRAILAVLSEAGIKLTACTLTGGRTLCVDARQARALCRAYGLPHVVVSLDEQFLRDLPSYVVEASRLSGGLASLRQAHEVYFYRQLKGLGSRRLSGNLGNQVGRQGVEGVTERKSELPVLGPVILNAGSTERNEHWLYLASRRPGRTLHRTLIQCEALFSSLGNYSIGHHFMTQQSPYASRELIETSLAATFSEESGSFLPNRARLRDLRHRFFGEPLGQSFQRKIISATGGFAATFPINWGWRASGGISLRGLAWGGLAFADAASLRWPPRSSFMRQRLRIPGVDGMYEIRPWREWFDHALREFVNDTLRSRLVTESDLFNTAAVVRLLDEHYHGVRPHYDTLLATLDLALAQQLFAEPLCETRARHCLTRDWTPIPLPPRDAMVAGDLQH